MKNALMLVAALLMTACSSAKPCKSTCSGCCDAADTCQSGSSALACGLGGQICHACLLGQTCFGQSCITLGGSGGGSAAGGGSGTGGGVATGGGSATGGGAATGGGSATGGGGSATGGGSAAGGGSATGGGAGTGGGGATNNKPNVLLVIDKSGSMAEPMNPQNANCPTGCGPSTPCPSNCPTRLSEVTAGIDTFLSNNASVARFGAEFFPIDTVCSGATLDSIGDGGVDLPSGADSAALLQMQASAVAAKVGAITPGGGTPTAASLNVLDTYAPLGDPTRHNWVVLLTDGVPNCNPNNPNTCNDPNSCQCTVLQGQCTTTNGFCQLGCVDVDGTAMAEIALQQRGIKTVVIGVGTDLLTGNGPMTMQTMGQAGGYVRTCPFGTNTECLPGTCDTNTKVCSVPYFTIGSQTELVQALQTVAATF